uniref:Secreted protein n=1 Tax=Anopheles coluzzii TaxID=1518534 RepID=A0A8W7P5N6_ANOCL
MLLWYAIGISSLFAATSACHRLSGREGCSFFMVETARLSLRVEVVLVNVAPLDSDCSLWFDWVSLWSLSEAIRSRLLSLLSSLCRKLDVSDEDCAVSVD